MNILRRVLGGVPKSSFVVLCGLAFAGIGQSSLIHQYTFNGDANDQVSGGINGSLNNGAVASGGVLSLDGVNDTVTFGGNYLIPTSGAFTVTLSARLNLDGNVREFISQGGGGPAFYIGPYGNEMRVGDFTDWTPTQAPMVGGNCGHCTLVAAPSDGAWHNYAVSVDASGNGAFYIDGLLAATHTGLAYSTAGVPTSLGTQYNGGEFLNGSLSDVRIYDNALSGIEIAQISAADIGAPEPASALMLGSALLGVGLAIRRKRAA